MNNVITCFDYIHSYYTPPHWGYKIPDVLPEHCTVHTDTTGGIEMISLIDAKH